MHAELLPLDVREASAVGGQHSSSTCVSPSSRAAGMTVLLAPEPVDDYGVDDQIGFHEDPEDPVDQDASQFDINFFLT